MLIPRIPVSKPNSSQDVATSQLLRKSSWKTPICDSQSLANRFRMQNIVQKTTKDPEIIVQEVGRDRSRIIRPSLIAPKHSKTSVLGAFVLLKRGVSEL